jgi:hypothetical protein
VLIVEEMENADWTVSFFLPFMLSFLVQKAQPPWCKDGMLQTCIHLQMSPD